MERLNDIPRYIIHALAAAVVQQAVEDYRACIRWRSIVCEKQHTGNRMSATDRAEKVRKDCENSMREIERFFRLDWFYTLCDCDGERVIRNLRQERYLHQNAKARARMGL